MLYNMLTFKTCVGVFSGTLEDRMLKLGIHMDNELLYCGIENRTPCSYSSLHLSIFLSFKAKFVSQFTLELCKLESSNMVYVFRMSNCIVGLRLRIMALIFSSPELAQGELLGHRDVRRPLYVWTSVTSETYETSVRQLFSLCTL